MRTLFANGLGLAVAAFAGAVLCFPAIAAPQVGPCGVFPDSNIWNTRIDDLPVDPRSADYIASIGAELPLFPDFGAGEYEGNILGIPFVIVPFGQEKVEIRFEDFGDEPAVPDESDQALYPIPPDAPIEGNPDSVDDRHVIVVQEVSCTLHELYKARPNEDGSWSAVSAVKFDLETNTLRADGWTSADAAGLPIFPGLVRWEEVEAGEINHAIRFTAEVTRKDYIWPARHFASENEDPALPPLGQRFRLRADYDISGFSPANQVILTALKTYGMMLADNGSPWFISGAPNNNWDNDDLHELKQVLGSDFEAVDITSLIGTINSAEVGAREAPAETGGNGTAPTPAGGGAPPPQ